jgi:hypothetical protein
MVERDEPQVTVRRMRFACWISKVINTHLDYVILTACQLPQRLQERASMLRYTLIGCLVSYRLPGKTGLN